MNSYFLTKRTRPIDTLLIINVILICALHFSMPSCTIKQSSAPAAVCDTSLYSLGNQAYANNEYKLALDYYIRASRKAENENNQLQVARCLERMASVHLSIDDSYLALKLYYEALPIFEKYNDPEGLGRVYNILGVYKYETKSYDSAEAYLNKAIEFNQQAGNLYNLAENKANLANLYHRQGKLTEAIRLNMDVAGVFLAQNDSLSLPIIYENLSIIHLDMGEFESAQQYLYQALQYAEPQRDSSLLGSLYLELGRNYMKQQFSDSARIYLFKSLQTARATSSLRLEFQALTEIVKLNSMIQSPQTALSHYARILELKDSLNARKVKNNARTLELQYENERIKNQSEIQQLKLQAAEQEKRKLYLIILFAITSGILFLVIIMMQRKNFNKTKEITANQLLINQLTLEKIQKDQEIDKMKLNEYEQELQIKQNQLITSTLKIEQKNEFLQEMVSKIKDTFPENGIKSPIKIKDILSTLQKQVADKQDTELFNKEFGSIHKAFFQKLQEIHPGLSPNEIKFCAYLYLRLSSHQIAAIQHVSPEAIRKTRYRLRKKMNLPPETSLESYITGF